MKQKTTPAPAAKTDSKKTKITAITISPIASSIEKITITDDKSMTMAVSILSQLNQERDKLTADKEKLTKPMNEALKEIRSRYKPFEATLEGAIAYLRSQMTTYQTKALAAANAKQEKIAAKVGDTLTPEQAMNKLAKVETPDEKVSTAFGDVSFRPYPMYEITDLKKLVETTGDAYVVVEINREAIQAAIKAGVKIEGVKHWIEQRPVNRR